MGGTTRRARNIIAANNILGIGIGEGGSTGNLVQGNFIGTDVTGTKDLGNGLFGVTIANALGNTIGGTARGAGNLISGDNRIGIWMINPNATGNRVQGNLIGTDITGTIALGNSYSGVLIQNAPNNIIGGTTAGARNVISGNNSGVVIYDKNATGNLVQGNFIGTKTNGTGELGNAHDGIAIFGDASNNTVSKNRIAFNGRGVGVGSGTNNAISSNSIHSNTGLGIDLVPDGLTPNDEGDGDTGANNLQNFPVLTATDSDDDEITIEGTLNSAPNTTFRLEFFSNPDCDPSNHGEGKKFLGSKNVTIDGSGKANFKARFEIEVARGQWITATATDPSNNTSEFSQCFAVTASSSQAAAAKANQNESEAANESDAVPEEFALLQNYPNPFNPETEISFQLPQASYVAVKIFNVVGAEIRTLVDEQREAGYHHVRWDGKDKNGKLVASGVYLCQLRAGSFSQVRKMSLLR